VTALGVLLLVLQVAAPPPAADVDPAIAALVQRFYETQEKEDIDGYLALWSPNGNIPQRAQLQYIFDQGDDRFSNIVITHASVTGARARVRVSVQRSRSVARPGPLSGTLSNFAMSVALTLEKTGSEWKLLSEGPAADHLAGVLLEAATDAERDSVLASEPDVAGLPLLSSLARFGGNAAVKQDYAQAVTVYQTLVFAARRGGFKKEEGEALQNIANALYFQRKYPEALAAYEQRLTLERERHDDAGVAAALAGVATIRYSYAEYTEALARYQEALALHEKTDDVAGIAFVSLSIGNIGFLQGDFPAAIAAYRRALDLNRTMFNVDGESRALEGLGRVYTAQGDYAGALVAFESVRTDKRLATARARLAPVAQSIGDVHIRLGNLDAARASYEEGRGHYEAVRDMPNVGRVLQGLGLTELAAARFPIAEGHYKRSEEICRNADDPEGAARAVAGLAYAQEAQDKFWDAAASYRRAIEAFKTLGLREEMARSEIGLSLALAGAGDFAGGVEAAVGAHREAVGIENDDVLWRALTAEARAVHMLGDRPRALGIARAAVGALDRLEAAALDRPGTSLPADAARALATFALLQAESGDAAGAFATAERIHAVELRAALAINERDIFRGMSPGDREEERRLATQVTTLVARIAREKILPKPDAAVLAKLQQSLADATAERRAWMQRLFERLPEIAEWRGLAPAAAPDFKGAITEGSLLLSFVLDDHDLLVLTARPSPAPPETERPAANPSPLLEAHIAPLKRRQFADLIAALLQPAVLADPAASRKGMTELAALLPGPVVSQLQRASRVAIIPHEVLWRIPFNALPSGDGYLSDHATVVLAGSVAMFTRALDRAPVPDAPMIAVGAPQLASPRLDRFRQVAPSWILRAAEDGVNEIAAAGGGTADASTVLTGTAATERAVRDALPRAGRLQISAPFRINAASPLFSVIVLTAPDPAEPPTATDGAAPGQVRTVEAADDGALELREVMNLSSAARLTVLSDGAATAMRDSAATVQVLQWGWLAAGVPSVLVARWSPPPPARDRLMTELHKRLQAGEAPASALGAAQRAVRATPGMSAPINWAGWLLTGSR
jgi:tetratricopeptide (TPR) repeat protein/CHAT domain-containing protein